MFQGRKSIEYKEYFKNRNDSFCMKWNNSMQREFSEMNKKDESLWNSGT